MKTFDNKNITKKQIVATLRSQDRTAIYRLVHIIYGGKPTNMQVYKFIQEFAPTQAIYRNAYKMTIDYSINRHLRDFKKEAEFEAANIRHICVKMFFDELERGIDNYSKRPMLGHTHLYFCSPVYGHNDYNKSQMMPIEGNERFCEVLCKLADKCF